MDTTVKALQAVYIAFGGALDDTYSGIADGAAVGDYTVIPDMVSAIAKKAASAGIELPPVTTTDNGDVLTVVEGAWAKADVPKELPDPPTANGTYRLQAVKSNDGVTYSWVSDVAIVG